MAKKENTADLMGGLSFGSSKETEKPIAFPEVVENETQGDQELHPARTAQKIRKKQTRSARMQLLLTQDLFDKMENAVARGTINSKNDLVNILLEQYFKK